MRFPIRKASANTALAGLLVGLMAFWYASRAYSEVSLSGSLGYQYWNALGDLRPDRGGRFKSAGPVFSATVHWRLKRFEARRFLIGLDAGYFDHGSDIESTSSTLDATGSYVAASLIYPVHRNAYLEMGLGHYRVRFGEHLVKITAPGRSPPERVDELQEPGLFLGGGWDLGRTSASQPARGWTIGAKLHFPAFDEPGGLGSDVGSLAGPILSLQVGYRSTVGF